MKKSNLSNFIILTLVITIAILITIGSYYKTALKKRIYKDALIVNQLGKIRGDIQRFAKLKIASDKKNILVKKEIGQTFVNLESLLRGKGIIPSSCKEHFFAQFNHLKDLWNQTKTADNKTVLPLSEKAWRESNKIIDNYEYIHKIKFNTLLRNMDLFIYISIVFLTVITFMVYFKIKKGLEIDIIHDKLTGLYNRLFFDTQYNYLLNKAKRDNIPLSMIIIDIDNFKKINDTYGHKKGDSILKKVGEVIKHSVRNTDLAFRYGGEEFVVLLPNTSLKDAVSIAKRIKDAIPQNVKLDNTPVTVSGGIGEYDKKEDFKEFFKRVDNALYEAKRKGKNQIIKA